VVRKKFYILGGWFGRLYGALELERRLGQESNIRVADRTALTFPYAAGRTAEPLLKSYSLCPGWTSSS
jgi:hypothetical protein